MLSALARLGHAASRLDGFRHVVPLPRRAKVTLPAAFPPEQTPSTAAVRAFDSAELCQSDSDDFNRGPR